jgi:hypothetical protein
MHLDVWEIFISNSKESTNFYETHYGPPRLNIADKFGFLFSWLIIKDTLREGLNQPLHTVHLKILWHFSPYFLMVLTPHSVEQRKQQPRSWNMNSWNHETEQKGFFLIGRFISSSMDIYPLCPKDIKEFAAWKLEILV